MPVKKPWHSSHAELVKETCICTVLCAKPRKLSLIHVFRCVCNPLLACYTQNYQILAYPPYFVPVTGIAHRWHVTCGKAEIYFPMKTIREACLLAVPACDCCILSQGHLSNFGQIPNINTVCNWKNLLIVIPQSRLPIVKPRMASTAIAIGLYGQLSIFPK